MSRPNGLIEKAPELDQLILVAGGGGYIGTTLVPMLVKRGYRVRVLDLFWWGEDVLLNAVSGGVETFKADIRDIPKEAFAGVDKVINLAGLSNDPTAEYDPEANWQMNAVATEKIGQACLENGIERIVFASSCSLYDGLEPGMHNEDAAIKPRAAYATSKAYGEEALLNLDGLDPVILRNGTVYGYSPRMRYDLVVNTFMRDAFLKGELTLHGGGRMWRPLVDVQDVSAAMIVALEAESSLAGGEIFNILHSNYQIRELAMMVAGSVSLTGREVKLKEEPAPPLTRDYECSNAKISTRLGFNPSRSVITAIDDLLIQIQSLNDLNILLDEKYYNLPWLEKLMETEKVF